MSAKELAAKKEKEMAELDQEFGGFLLKLDAHHPSVTCPCQLSSDPGPGVGELVTSAMKKEQQKEYGSRHLQGLTVGHSAEAFGDKATILTLADGDILDEQHVDTLTNVNIEDDERLKKSHQNVKEFKEGYKAYDSEVVDELTGEVGIMITRFVLIFCFHSGEEEGAALSVQGVAGGGEEGEFPD